MASCLFAALCSAGLGLASPNRTRGAAIPVVAGAPQLAVDHAGRLVVAFGDSDCLEGERSPCGRSQLLIRRYLPDGQADTTFGRGGTATVTVGRSGVAIPFDIAIQPGNRLVVGVTRSGTQAFDSAILLVAVTSTGRLDRSFGSAGMQYADPRPDATGLAPIAMAPTEDGGVVLAGYSYFDWRPRFAVARYTADGRPASSFGDGGIMRGDFSDAMHTRGATALAMDPAGRILVAGEAGGGYGLARLLGDGSFDGSFSADGRTIVAADHRPYTYNSSVPTDVFALGDGRILVAGSQDFGDHGGCSEIVSARVTTDGEADPTYGEGGVERHRERCAGVVTALLGPDAQLTTAGSIFNYFEPEESEYVVRRPDGGVVAGTLHDPGGSRLSDAALMRDGDLILAGTVASQTCAVGPNVSGAPCRAIALKRVNPDGIADSSFGDGGLITYPSIDPTLNRARFRLLVAQSLPETVRVHRDLLTVRVICPAEIRTGCRFTLALKMRRGSVIKLSPTSLDAGTTRRLSAATAGVKTGKHGNLRGKVFAAGQKPVDVHARVRIRR